ncbi:hypothetical protein RMATCC62417_09252 [Rhizopus microsporus]|nr:hypothetical protein RMATCC62417_09252 [Rhizopus microsporus]
MVRLYQLVAFCIFFHQCAAQLGAKIFYPENNATITPGEKINTQFRYNNMGPGQYTLDINLWKDSAARELAYNVAKGISLPEGNISGTHNDFSMNGTYSWTVPHGLDELIYLTVHANVTHQGSVLTMRSNFVMLHVNSALSHLPMPSWMLLIFTIFILTIL